MVKPVAVAAGADAGAVHRHQGAPGDRSAAPGLPLKPFAHLLGRQAPAFALPGLRGETVSLASARGADAWLLYFTDAACGACKAAYPAVAKAAGVLPIVAIATGDPDLMQAHIGEAAVAIGREEQLPRRPAAAAT